PGLDAPVRPDRVRAVAGLDVFIFEGPDGRSLALCLAACVERPLELALLRLAEAAGGGLGGCGVGSIDPRRLGLVLQGAQLRRLADGPLPGLVLLRDAADVRHLENERESFAERYQDRIRPTILNLWELVLYQFRRVRYSLGGHDLMKLRASAAVLFLLV